MLNIYVEPEPKGLPEGSAATHYVLEFERGARVTSVDYPTLATAIAVAKGLGHQPLVARIPNANKHNPDHWRAA